MKVEYSDVKRFIVSIGVISVSLAFLIPWLIYREPFGMDFTRSELTDLTLLGVILVYVRQSMGLILSIIPLCVSPLLFFVGIGLVFFGLRNWWDMQVILDRRDIAITGQEEIKLKNMTDKEIEIDRVVDLQYDEEAVNLEPARYRNLLDKYADIEDDIFNKIRKCISKKDYKVKTNQRLGNVFFDGVIQNNDISQSDLILEIKYASKGYKGGWVIETANRVLLGLDVYRRDIKNNATAKVLFISPEVPRGKASYHRSILKDDRFRGQVGVKFLSEDQINFIKCDELLRLLFVD